MKKSSLRMAVLTMLASTTVFGFGAVQASTVNAFSNLQMEFDGSTNGVKVNDGNSYIYKKPSGTDEAISMNSSGLEETDLQDPFKQINSSNGESWGLSPASISNVNSADGTSIEGNKLIMTGGTTQVVYAARVDSNGGDANNNTIVFNGGTNKEQLTVAGVYGAKNAKSNELWIYKAGDLAEVSAAHMEGAEGDGIDNYVFIGSGNHIKIVAAADSFDDHNNGILAGNEVTAASGHIQSVYGAAAYVDDDEDTIWKGVPSTQTSKDVRGNRVELGDDSNEPNRLADAHVGVLVGGLAEGGKATGNRVKIQGGFIDYQGGFEFADEDGKHSVNGADINGVKRWGKSNNANYIVGGMSDVAATDNEVKIEDASAFVNNNVGIWGGHHILSTATGDVKTGNTLKVINVKDIVLSRLANFETYNFELPSNVVNGDTIIRVIDPRGTDVSHSKINVGVSGAAPVLYNGDKITLIRNENGLNTTGVQYGKLQQGVSLSYDLKAQDGGDNKSVIAVVSNGTDVPKTSTLADDMYNTNPNESLTLSPTETVPDALLNGKGELSNIKVENGQTLSLKNLNVFNLRGLSVSKLAKFDNYNFLVRKDFLAPAANLDRMQPIIRVSDPNGTDISGSHVNVALSGNADGLHKGDEVRLIYNEHGVKADDVVYGQARTGVSLAQSIVAQADPSGKAIVARVDELANGGQPSVLPQTKSIVETRAAVAGFVNNGQNLMENTYKTQGLTDGTSRIVAAVDNDHMRMETGSYAKVHGTHALLGVRKDYGRTYWGPFIEAGWGNYDTHLDSGVRADGNVKYYGLGVYGKTTFNHGRYLEASLRGGRASYDYKSNDLTTLDGRTHVSYDADNTYYGAHLGFGKVKNFTKGYTADVYGKLFYNHQNAADATLEGVGLGETYDFDAVDSLRSRIGVRMTKELANHNSWYAGLAYEYEFLGDADAQVKGFNTLTPSLGGASGLVEMGYLYGTDKDAFGAGLNIEGWFGKKRGVLVGGSVHWKF